jgi:phage-related protein
MLGDPHARRLRGKLWELRPFPNRIIYFAYTGRQMVLLHGFTKKTEKTAKREIETAITRHNEFIERLDR